MIAEIRSPPDRVELVFIVMFFLLTVIGLVRLPGIWRGTDVLTSRRSPFPVWYARIAPAAITTLGFMVAAAAAGVAHDVLDQPIRSFAYYLELAFGGAFLLAGVVTLSVYLFGRPTALIPPRLRHPDRDAAPGYPARPNLTSWQSVVVIVALAIALAIAWYLGIGNLALTGVLLGFALLVGFWADRNRPRQRGASEPRGRRTR